MRQCLWPHRRASKKLATAWLFQRLGAWKLTEYHCRLCEEKKAYENRKCGKHPRSENPLVTISPCWAPRVKAHDGTSRVIPGYIEAECPTSYLTPESAWILELIGTSDIAHDATSGALWGPDTRKYPAWWIDALGAVAGAKAAYDRAEFEANQPKK